MGRKEVVDQKRSLGEREREEVEKVNMDLVGDGRTAVLRWMVVAVGIGAEDRVEEDLDNVRKKVLEVVVGERGRMDLLCMGVGVGTQVRR